MGGVNGITFSQKQNKIFIMYRVVIIGAESTGKSTLVEQLAAHYEAPFSQEFVRDFVESVDRPISAKDLNAIMKGQISCENTACEKSPRLVFHDTNLLSNIIYADYYFKQHPKELDCALSATQYDLYLFCQNEIPWEPDGEQRDSPQARDEIHQVFEQMLEASSVPVVIIKGKPEDRFYQAINAIQECLSKGRI
jgi:NadR type nicotinamide-nucleotide adenylyltransferase